MKILVIQEADWTDVGIHDSHQIFERLNESGHQIRVIDHEFRWRKNLDRKGLISPRREKTVARVVSGAEISVITPGFVRISFLDYFTTLISHRFEISRQIKIFSPDIIIGLGIFNSSFASKKAKKKGIPFVYYILDELHKLVPNRQLSPIARIVESGTMRRADQLIVTSVALRDYASSMGAEMTSIEFVPHGYAGHEPSIERRRKIRTELGLNERDIVLFFMGWLYDFSGLLELVEEILATEREDLKLLIVGKGDIENKLMDLANGPARGKLLLQGWKPFEEIFDFLNAADICVMPFQNIDLMKNSVPIKIIEYLASGKPVISTPLNGIIKEFGTDGGILYAEKSSEFIEQVLYIDNNDLYDKYGEKAVKSVENREWGQITSRFASILERIVMKEKEDSK